MKFLINLFSKTVFYPTHGWNILMSRIFSFRNWWDEVDPGLILGARPSHADAEQLARLGVTGVVNTCDEYEGPKETYRKLGVEQLYIPTIDFTHPGIEDVESAVEFVTHHVNQGGRVYVHCKAGRARSATVAVCWLVDFRKMDPVEAQNHLLQRRHQVNRRLLKRPVVQEFIRRRKDARDSRPG